MRPVLIYVSKEQCPACVQFERSRVWERIKLAIGDKNAIFVKFHVNPFKNEVIPDVLTKPDYLYPMIILAAPQSYYRCFTPDDKINPTCPPGYKIKGFRYGVVEEPSGKYIWSGRAPTVESVVDWFNKVSPQIPSIDDSGVSPSGHTSYWTSRKPS